MKYKFGDKVQLYNCKKGYVFPISDEIYMFIEESAFNEQNQGSIDTVPYRIICDANIRTIL